MAKDKPPNSPCERTFTITTGQKLRSKPVVRDDLTSSTQTKLQRWGRNIARRTGNCKKAQSGPRNTSMLRTARSAGGMTSKK